MSFKKHIQVSVLLFFCMMVYIYAADSVLGPDMMKVDDDGITYNLDGAVAGQTDRLGFNTAAPQAPFHINLKTLFRKNVGWNKVLDSDTNINWNTFGNVVYISRSNSFTLTFTAPTLHAPASKMRACILTLVIDHTNVPTITWPATVKWENGYEPYHTAVGTSRSFYHFYYNGTNYYGWASQDFIR
jgi:hypothetical protein